MRKSITRKVFMLLILLLVPIAKDALSADADNIFTEEEKEYSRRAYLLPDGIISGKLLSCVYSPSGAISRLKQNKKYIGLKLIHKLN